MAKGYMKNKSNNLFRPVLHFTPERNWINDPNGLIYLNGKYHLFFQHNPLGNKWGNISWGHAVSEDLIRWEELPLAIPHEDGAMVYSGTTVLDKNNSAEFGHNALVAIYTTSEYRTTEEGEIIPTRQYQSLAYSLDEGLTFTKYKGNPVLDIGSDDFRDPKVFWYEPTQKWIMVVSLGEQYRLGFYQSANLKEWEPTGTFGPKGDTQKVWECPDLFYLPMNGEEEGKWVLTLSAGSYHSGFQGMQYFIGEFNGKVFVPDPQNPAQYLNFGKDFYAGITFVNLPTSDGVIMLGWIGNFIYGQELPTHPWRGAISLPRRLALKREAGRLRLFQQPIIQLPSKPLFPLPFDQPEEIENEVISMEVRSNCYQIQLSFSSITANRIGLRIFQSFYEHTEMAYEPETGYFYFERNQSGLIDFHPEFSSIDRIPLSLEQGQLHIQVIADVSIVEVFLQRGRKVMTYWVFPSPSYRGLQIFSEGGAVMLDACKVEMY